MITFSEWSHFIPLETGAMKGLPSFLHVAETAEWLWMLVGCASLWEVWSLCSASASRVSRGRPGTGWGVRGSPKPLERQLGEGQFLWGGGRLWKCWKKHRMKHVLIEKRLQANLRLPACLASWTLQLYWIISIVCAFPVSLPLAVPLGKLLLLPLISFPKNVLCCSSYLTTDGVIYRMCFVNPVFPGRWRVEAAAVPSTSGRWCQALDPWTRAMVLEGTGGFLSFLRFMDWRWGAKFVELHAEFS